MLIHLSDIDIRSVRGLADPDKVERITERHGKTFDFPPTEVVDMGVSTSLLRQRWRVLPSSCNCLLAQVDLGFTVFEATLVPSPCEDEAQGEEREMLVEDDHNLPPELIPWRRHVPIGRRGMGGIGQ